MIDKLSFSNSFISGSAERISGNAKELILADRGAPEILELLKGAQAPALTLGLHDSPAAVIQTITTALAGMAGIRLHIVAHGRPGAFFLGGQWIDEAALAQSAALVAQWGVKQIALWSCDVGQDVGLIRMLSCLSGASVEASTQPLGWQEGGANWSLDCSIDDQALNSGLTAGSPMSSAVLPVEPSLMTAWPYQLAILSLSGAAVYEVSSTVDKETNSHTFSTRSLGDSYTIKDLGNGANFSGNDVVVELKFGDTTVYGWISRPIKVNGVVVGFYFWKDAYFNSFKNATDYSNADPDAFTSNNTGYILVVPGKTSHFSSGTIGSSSDRVDSALNALIPVNTAPTAVADASDLTIPAGQSGGPALEKGGSNNGTAGANAVGNVLSNDTDPDASDTKTVVFAGKASANTSVNADSGLEVTGSYGKLTIQADGTYSYAVTNGNTDVQKLRTSNDMLSDVFYYQIKDSQGATSTTTLTVKIRGANDNPIAVADYNTAKESITTPSALTGYIATGSVKLNDTDVDAGDGLAVSGYSVTGGAKVATATVNAANAQLTFTGASGFTSVKSGDALYVLNNGNYYAAYDSTGVNRITLSSPPVISGSTVKLNLSGDPGGYRVSASSFTKFTDLGYDTFTAFFKDAAHNSVRLFKDIDPIDYLAESNDGKLATVSSAESNASTTLAGLSEISGTIAVGMSVTVGTTTAQVSDLTYTNGVLTGIKLDQSVTIASDTALTFTGSSAAGSTLLGAHGTLKLDADGTYTYTPTTDNSYLSEGQSADEIFSYTVADTVGATSSNTLTIKVYGTGSNDPILANDTANATEAGGTANGTAAVNISVAAPGLLSNDTATQGSLTVTGFTDSAGSAGTLGVAFQGQYGKLTIGSTGAYTYVVYDDNPAVQALATSSDSLSESFIYTAKNSSDREGTAKLTINIKGANDAPVAGNVSAIATEAGGGQQLDPWGQSVWQCSECCFRY